MGYFQPGSGVESVDVGVENSDAGFSRSFFAVAAEYLHPDANTQYRLSQGADEAGEIPLLEVFHRFAHVADSGQYHAVGAADKLRIGGHRTFGVEPSQGVFQ